METAKIGIGAPDASKPLNWPGECCEIYILCSCAFFCEKGVPLKVHGWKAKVGNKLHYLVRS